MNMKISDNEKRDILKLIQEGKDLPEKYRFLLFKETRQVELNWNGKSEEVTNIDLPFQIIEQIDEPRTEVTYKFPSGPIAKPFAPAMLAPDAIISTSISLRDCSLSCIDPCSFDEQADRT